GEPEDDQENDATAGGKSAALPIRSHLSKASRSMSPAVGRTGMSGTNGARAGSPPRFAGAGGTARDSFLNYFFGKDGGLPPSNGLPGNSMSSSNLPIGSRHVSANIEPSFAGSIRRGDTKLPERPLSSHISVPGDYETEEADNGYPLADEGPALTEREALETELIRRLISSYFNIVRETIADQVPKAVMHLLVNHSKEVVQNRLVSELYKEELFGELLYEDDAIKSEREKCEKLLSTYKEAAKIIGEVL
ncbi:dynamin-1, partial [Aureobasidium melanogenum]